MSLQQTSHKKASPKRTKDDKSALDALVQGESAHKREWGHKTFRKCFTWGIVLLFPIVIKISLDHTGQDLVFLLKESIWGLCGCGGIFSAGWVSHAKYDKLTNQSINGANI